MRNSSQKARFRTRRFRYNEVLLYFNFLSQYPTRWCLPLGSAFQSRPAEFAAARRKQELGCPQQRDGRPLLLPRATSECFRRFLHFLLVSFGHSRRFPAARQRVAPLFFTTLLLLPPRPRGGIVAPSSNPAGSLRTRETIRGIPLGCKIWRKKNKKSRIKCREEYAARNGVTYIVA